MDTAFHPEDSDPDPKVTSDVPSHRGIFDSQCASIPHLHHHVLAPCGYTPPEPAHSRPTLAELSAQQLRAARAIAPNLIPYKPLNRPTEFLWSNILPRGQITLFAGPPAIGKTYLALDLAARVSCGRPAPFVPIPGEDSVLMNEHRKQHESQLALNPGSVALLGLEDREDRVVVPRLERFGADLTRIHRITGITRPLRKRPSKIDLELDQRELDTALCCDIRPSLFIIDPIMLYISNSTRSIRFVFEKLSELARHTNAAILIITHTKSNACDDILYHNLVGCPAFTTTARHLWSISMQPDGKTRRLTLEKTSISLPNQYYTFTIQDEGCRFTSTIPTDQPLSPSHDPHNPHDPDSPLENCAREEARDFLLAKLKDGPRPTRELLDEATLNLIPERTLRRARRELPIVAFQVADLNGPGTHAWMWSLSPNNTCQPTDNGSHCQINC